MKKNLFFCSLSGSFTYKATSDANACPSSEAVSMCIPTWNSKKQVFVGVKPCRGNVCAPGHLNTETISLQNSGVSSWRLLLAALEIILYLELQGTQGILKANRQSRCPKGVTIEVGPKQSENTGCMVLKTRRWAFLFGKPRIPLSYVVFLVCMHGFWSHF